MGGTIQLPAGPGAVIVVYLEGSAVMHVAGCRNAFAVCLVGWLWTGAVRADNWPQWRGPSNNGICKETNLPTEWSATNNIVWQAPLPGMGGSTPAIWGDHIFLTSADGKDLVLVCIGTEGKELWKRKLGTGDRQFMRGEGNSASASPCTDGTHVYASVSTGDFACFDFDGNEIWKFNAQERYGRFNIMHGFHITPVLDGDRLYMAYLHSGGHWVVAIDKATGKDVWKVQRKSDAEGENEHAYASPCIWRDGKNEYLIVHGNDYTTAHRLSDGEEIWRVTDLNPADRYRYDLRLVASPVATAGLIVVPTAKGGAVVGVKPDGHGLIKPGSPSEQWRRPRGTPDVPSPLVVDDLVYLCGEMGLLTCLDAKAGNEVYTHTFPRDRYRASPVYADGKVYLTSRGGTVSVVKAGPKFELLATNKLPDEISASPAIANGRIYLRGFKALYAIGSK
jgi:outer membrane protein assembly factor BamB